MHYVLNMKLFDCTRTVYRYYCIIYVQLHVLILYHGNEGHTCSLNHTVGLINIGGAFPVWTLILIVATIAAIIVACTSRNDQQPIYHCVSCVYGYCCHVSCWTLIFYNSVSLNTKSRFTKTIKLVIHKYST